MKNVQVIDGAANSSYSLFAISDRDFEAVFPGDADIEFAEDLFRRLGKKRAGEITERMWKRPVNKKAVRGIHGTLFYGLRDQKKIYYPTKRESEMTDRFGRSVR